MSDAAPERFRGMERFAARKAVLAALEVEGLRGGESKHTHSAALSRAIRTALAKDPQQRFQSASQFREALAKTKEAMQDARNSTTMWEGISGVFQNLRPASGLLANNDRLAVILAASSTAARDASKGAGSSSLPPALRGLASTLSCFSGSARSDS
jgi:hypothetical protein